MPQSSGGYSGMPMEAASPPMAPPSANWPMRALSWIVVHLRWVVLIGWLIITAATVHWLPGLSSAPSIGFKALIPSDSQPLIAANASKSLFAFPVENSLVAVQHSPSGLPPGYEAAAIVNALAGTLHSRHITAAVPVTNTLVTGRLPPTTVVYYLFTHPSASLEQMQHAAQHFAAGLPHAFGARTGISGLAPAEIEHSNLVGNNLDTVELATILWVLFAVGLHFRSLIAPLVDLIAVGISYLTALHVVGWVGQQLGQTGVPREAKPLMVVLLFGIVTDYTIFLCSFQRTRLRQGLDGRRAAHCATRDVAGLVFVAGMTVAGATACVTLAPTQFFSSFGPALAIAVFIAVIVAITWVPAALAILGRWAFWPRRPDPGGEEVSQADEATKAAKGLRGMPLRGRIVRVASRHPIITGGIVAAGLIAGATGIRAYSISAPELRSLPASSPAARGYALVKAGFPHAQGVIAPTVVIAEGQGIAQRPQQLARFGDLLNRQPGVAAVLGSGDQPLPADYGITRSPGGNAARYLVVFRTPPMETRAITMLGRLERRAPALAREAGLGHVRLLYGGQTSLARAIVGQTTYVLELVGPVALAVIFLIIALFLRAAVAPLYLMVASALSVATALGITGYVHDSLISGDGIEFFVPVATMVLLLALGSDYTVFLIGRIWREAPGRPLREAIIHAGTRASHPITTAGIVLSGSFAMLAFLPITSYRTAAFTMAIGLLIDALIVRTLLVPALVSLFGRRSEEPGHQLEPKET